MSKTITFLISGTYGDVLPYIALGKGLREAGYEIRMAAPIGFANLIQESKFTFAPYEGNPSDLLLEQGDQTPLTLGSNFIHSINATRNFTKQVRPLYTRMLHTAANACRGSNILIHSAAAIWGAHIADGLGIPAIRAVLQPIAPTREFPSAFLPFRFSFSRLGNWLTHWFMTQGMWLAWRREINQARQADFSLPPAQWTDSSLQAFSKQPLTLNGFSEHVLPRPQDWNEKQVITGYWRLSTSMWTPPKELEQFLDSSSNIISIGFGSQGTKEISLVLKILEEALKMVNAKAVLTIPAKWHVEITSKNIFPIEYVPHDWLYRRVQAAAHHGGAGTTSASLHAGIPTITMPLAIDQFFWGERVYKIGVGPKPIPQRALNAEKLANAIQQSLQDDEMRARAKTVSEALGKENGIQAAVRVIRDIL